MKLIEEMTGVKQSQRNMVTQRNSSWGALYPMSHKSTILDKLDLEKDSARQLGSINDEEDDGVRINNDKSPERKIIEGGYQTVTNRLERLIAPETVIIERGSQEQESIGEPAGEEDTTKKSRDVFSPIMEEQTTLPPSHSHDIDEMERQLEEIKINDEVDTHKAKTGMTE